jgi:hypothetical protein
VARFAGIGWFPLKRFWLIVLVVALAVPSCFAQINNVTVTGTVTDASGNPFAYANLTATLVDSEGNPVYSAKLVDGSIFRGSPARATLSSSGAFSISLPTRSSFSTPQGAQWNFTTTAPQNPAIILFAPAWTISYTVPITQSVDISAGMHALAQPISFLNMQTGQATFAGILGNYLPLAGGSLIGPLTLSGDPVANLMPATKQYVDPAFSGSANDSTARTTANNALPLAGGTMTGPVALSSDTPSGSQGASANAAVTTYSVLAYGAKGDWQQGGCLASVASGSSIITIGCDTFAGNSTDVGKWVVFDFYQSGLDPFATTPSAAQITGFIDKRHATMSRTAVVNENVAIAWGTDSTIGFNACSVAVKLSANAGGTCTIPAGHYLFGSSPFYALVGARDDGTYDQPGGFVTAANVTQQISGGSVTGYTIVSGGLGYTPNSSIPMAFSGGSCIAGNSCGETYALANTNASGTVTSITRLGDNYNLASAQTVTVNPLGGDGASVTANMSGGAISTFTINSGGGGYPVSNATAITWYGIGGGCTQAGGFAAGTVPTVANGTAATNSSGAISGLTITNNASGCSSSPTIVFGDFGACNSAASSVSPVWVQCTNLAPLQPTKIPVQVQLNLGVNFIGDRGGYTNAITLESVWSGLAQDIDTNEPYPMAGFIQSMELGNFTCGNTMFTCLVGQSNLNYTNWHDIVGNNGIFILSNSADIGTQFSNLSCNSIVCFVNGGWWTERDDFPRGGGGFFDAQSMTNTIWRPAQYGGVGSKSQKFDDYFANVFWHPEFDAYTTVMPETCKFPQSPNQRHTGPSMNGGTGADNMCYPGVASFGIEILTRQSRSTGNPSINNFACKVISRECFYGSIGAAVITGANAEAQNPITGTNDPYRNATTLEGMFKFSDCSSSFGGYAYINGISYSGGVVNRTLYSINSTTNDPVCTSWTDMTNFSATHPQPYQNANLQSTWNVPQGMAIQVSTNSNTTQPVQFFNYNSSGSPNVHTVDLQVIPGGLQVKTNGTTGGTLTDTLDVTTTGVASQVPVTVAPESGQATFLACYVTGGKFGHCATPPSGTPPTCGCTSP